jgi:glycosyltransferase involved in cell wall biosynthesis
MNLQRENYPIITRKISDMDECKNRFSVKIAFILPLIVSGGGANRFLAEYAEAFRKKGYNVRIYSLIYDPERTFDSFRRLNIEASRNARLSKLAGKITKWSISRWRRIVSPPLLLIGLILESLLVLKAYFTYRPQVIFVTGNHTLIGLLSLVLRKCRFVCYYHGLPPTLEWNSLFIRPLRLLEKFTMLKCLVLANSTFTAQLIMRKVKETHIKVIHPGVDFSRFANLQKFDDGKVLINVGRIHPAKKQHFLIHLMNKLRNIEGVKLIILGFVESEQYLNELHKLVRNYGLEDKITFVYHARDEELVDFLSRSTIYLHPSIETFGISIVEAMAAGVPVIAYKEGGQRDIVSHGVDGFLAGDSLEEWVNYINILLTDRALLEKMSQAAKKKATMFSWDRAVDKFERLLYSST